MTSIDPDIPFNRPFETGRERRHIADAIASAHLSADGSFTKRAQGWLRERTGACEVLLVHSATAALELAALVADIGPGDEVVMPSYTFVSTANAVVLRGATPVFVDIRPDTLNLDESLVDDAVGPATKAIIPVHYAGMACAIEDLCAIAKRAGLWLIEDAAQGMMAALDGRALGTFGSLGALSFHETKNVTCGEGGALLVNDPSLVRRAEIARAKGTNRLDLLRGDTDHYTWLERGSSYAMSELAAAFLWAQLESADNITAQRIEVWDAYHRAFEDLEQAGVVSRPTIPQRATYNAHMYYLLVDDRRTRDRLIEDLARVGIQAVFHYVPLHDSPGGRRFGRAHGELPVTASVAGRLLRLPLWVGMSERDVERVADGVRRALAGGRARDGTRRVGERSGSPLERSANPSRTPNAPGRSGG